MMKENQYNISPYLRLARTARRAYFFIDYLDDKIVSMNQEDYNFLSKFVLGDNPKHKDGVNRQEYLGYLAESNFLIDRKKIEHIHRLRRVEIETSTICNWRCQYCPAAEKKRPVKVMTMDLFEKILDLCKEYKTIKTVCIHAYCEPSVDPFFLERVKMIEKKGFYFELFTNGSNLSVDKINQLAASGNVKKVVFNFPSAVEDEFCRMTGSNQFKQVQKNISIAIKRKLPVYITVLSKEGTASPKVVKMFPGAYVDGLKVQDRAATLKNKEYSCNVKMEDAKLYGCFYFFQILYINSDGICFPCINDCLGLNYAYGNIQDCCSIDELMTNDKIRQLRRKIFGLEPVDSNFICKRCVFMKKNKQEFISTWMV